MIDKIIDLLKEVAEAYDFVQGFAYESPFEMNGAPNRLYPFVLVADTPSYSNKGEFRGNGLQNKAIWDIKVFMYDTYNQDERVTTVRQVKQQELKTAMDRYLAEVKLRALDKLGYNVEISGGFVAKRQMNTKLEQCTADIKVTGANTCNLGVFDYGE